MNRKLIITTFALLVSTILSAQINFDEGNWFKALEKAADQKSLIFLDGYTTWCGPCKMMDKNVYSRRTVGEFFNANFINFKMDMEKGPGPSLAKKFGIPGYPSYSFVAPNGQLVNSAFGYLGGDALIELAKEALAKFKQMDMTSNSVNPKIKYDIALASVESNAPEGQQLVAEYLDKQPVWDTQENMYLILKSIQSPGTKAYHFFVENRASFEQMFGREEVFEQVYTTVFRKAMSMNDAKSAFKIADKIYSEVYPNQADKHKLSFKMDFYRQKEDMKRYAKSAIKYYKKHPLNDALDLNNAAWSFYEGVKQKRFLKKALKWAEKSVSLDPQYYNMDTLARLYAKTKNKKKAKSTAELAIKIARRNGDDPSSMEDLLYAL